MNRVNNKGRTAADVWIITNDQVGDQGAIGVENLPNWLRENGSVPTLMGLSAREIIAKDIPYKCPILPDTLHTFVDEY